MTQNERRQIITLWESGVSVNKIYQMLPYGRRKAISMVAALKSEGVLKPRSKLEIAIKNVVYLWENETKDPHEIAKITGYTFKTTQRYLCLSGVRNGAYPTRQFKPKQLNDKAQAIMEALKEGKPMTKVAKEFGVSRQYVFQLKERLEKASG